MVDAPLVEADREAVELALNSMREGKDDLETSGPLEQAVGAAAVAGVQGGRLRGFPITHFVAVLELRSNLVTIVQKVAWMQERRAAGEIEEVTWLEFVASDIIVFHVLLRSLFDEVSGVVAALASKRDQLPPSFAGLRVLLTSDSPKSRRIRELLDEETCSAIEGCTWFDELREIREDMIHRRAKALVFLEPNRVLFQVHVRFAGRIAVPAVMFDDNLVDFFKYTALLFARLTVFLDNLSEVTIARFPVLGEVGPDSSCSVHAGYGVLRDALRSLLD